MKLRPLAAMLIESQLAELLVDCWAVGQKQACGFARVFHLPAAAAQSLNRIERRTSLELAYLVELHQTSSSLVTRRRDVCGPCPSQSFRPATSNCGLLLTPSRHICGAISVANHIPSFTRRLISRKLKLHRELFRAERRSKRLSEHTLRRRQRRRRTFSSLDRPPVRHIQI